MPRQTLAIATCRVSSDEQLENNSLKRQQDAVIKAATELGVTILEDDLWAGSISSKRGTNVNRKDLKAMIDRCKKDKRIKYLIVDEPDRFMRSIDEAIYFEVTVEVTIDPSNASIQDNLLSSITKKKLEIASLGDRLEQLHNSADDDKERFLRFAHDFINNMGDRFLEISPADRLRCKQMIFPGGFRLDQNKKVYTPEVSILYRVGRNKKDTEVPLNSHLVRLTHFHSNTFWGG